MARKLNVSDMATVLAKKGALIDKEIAKIVPKSNKIPNLNDAIWYILSAGGKRLRPAVGLLVTEALGGNIKQALRFGVAVELVHTFLLIHDDIEDGDLIRRNRPTLWAKYSLPHGVNTGDFVFAKVFDSILSLRELGLEDRRIVDLFDATTRCLIETGEGQAMDINARSKNDLSLDEYMQITRKKTGAYLTLPIVGACIISGVEKDILNAIRKYGEFVGPAFQIVDDVIDLTEGKGRKEVGCDIKEGKRSFMVVYTSVSCTSEEKTKLFEILNKPRDTKTAAEISWVIKLFHKYRAVAVAQNKAESLIEQGKKEVSSVPIKLRKVLEAFADFAVERSH